MSDFIEHLDEICINDYQVQQYNLNYTEEEMHRYTYSDEVRFMNNIRMGRPDAVKKCIQTSDSSSIEKVGHFAKSRYKQIEYMACSVFTKSCMAAIEGGLAPSTAYALSDLAKQKLELCKDVPDMLQLLLQVMVNFAQKVADTKNDKIRLSYIEKCKIYIANHLNTTFSLEDIANEIGINKFYLSKRFSEIEGIGIQKYTLCKRLEAAANMLKYSDSSILAIASYLHFSSQSHFGKAFRDYYGTTPKTYRDREKPADFM